MVIKVRPYWLPRDIACILLVIVYCPIFGTPGSAKVKDAVPRTRDTIEKVEQQNLDGAVLALENFNNTSITLRGCH